MRGQSLPQSGTVVLPGQHGMSSGMLGAGGSDAIGSPTDARMSIAINGGAIGASKKPAMARDPKMRPTADRIVMAQSYYSETFFYTARNFRRANWFKTL
jgi:hypothetical protein